jgi:hypothetical protein
MTYGGSATSLFGGAGSGVSGAAGDLAFANNNTTYGTAGSSGLAASSSANMNIGTLTALTMTGWIKADGGFTAINGGGGANTTFQRLFMIGAGTPDTGSANSVAVSVFNNALNGNTPAQATNALQLKLGGAGGQINGPVGTDGAITPSGTLNAYSDWTFFAVTIDLASANNNVNFYLGDTGSLSGPITLSYNNVGAAIGSIAFGTADSALLLNRANGQRGFDGYGDDFRLYNGTLDASGVSAVYNSARPVPEPSTLALAGLSFGGLVAAMRFRRNR